MADDSEKPSSSRDRSLLVTSCSNKRTRTGSENPSSSSEPVNFTLNDLQILLTEEVLQRLSTTKSVFLCKCVCKNWYSLISSPYFARRFITHHLNHNYEQNPSALFISYETEWKVYELFTFSDEPMFKSRGFELDYLPEENGLVRVLTSFNDLMLCSVCNRNVGEIWFYICNPFTVDWVALPLLEHGKNDYGTQVGFVCEPYYFQDSKGECGLNWNYRFRVVHFARSKYNQIIVRAYRSETQQWYRSVLEGSDYCPWYTDVVDYTGKFLWYNGEHIFAYDPFNPHLSTFIDCSYIHSTKFSWPGSLFCVGVCRGFLRMMQSASRGNVKALAIWELKDCDTGEWSLEEKVYLDGMILENSLLENILDGNKHTLLPLGFHPSDGAIVYLKFRAFLISCNNRTKELKMVYEVPVRYGHGTVFRIELPLWPTPIPKRIEVLPS